jgi:hypothetical protein
MRLSIVGSSQHGNYPAARFRDQAVPGPIKGTVNGFPGIRASFKMCLIQFCLALVLFAGAGHAAQVTLAWDANHEKDISGYMVYYGTSSRQYDWSIDVGKVTRFTVTGLSDGSTYYFAATAYDTSNLESKYSAEVVWPDAGIIQVLSPNAGEIIASGRVLLIEWNPGDPQLAVAKVKLSYTGDGGATWKKITTLSGNPGSYSWAMPAAKKAKKKCKIKILFKDDTGKTVAKGKSGYFTVEP